jgi:hypothetical protein
MDGTNSSRHTDTDCLQALLRMLASGQFARSLDHWFTTELRVYCCGVIWDAGIAETLPLKREDKTRRRRWRVGGGGGCCNRLSAAETEGPARGSEIEGSVKREGSISASNLQQDFCGRFVGISGRISETFVITI